MNETIIIELIMPKAIGKSQTLVVKNKISIVGVLKGINNVSLLNKVMKNESEFNQFILVYLDDERVKNPLTLLDKNGCIEIIIPMAGG